MQPTVHVFHPNILDEIFGYLSDREAMQLASVNKLFNQAARKRKKQLLFMGDDKFSPIYNLLITDPEIRQEFIIYLRNIINNDIVKDIPDKNKYLNEVNIVDILEKKPYELPNPFNRHHADYIIVYIYKTNNLHFRERLCISYAILYSYLYLLYDTNIKFKCGDFGFMAEIPDFEEIDFKL